MVIISNHLHQGLNWDDLRCWAARIPFLFSNTYMTMQKNTTFRGMPSLLLSFFPLFLMPFFFVDFVEQFLFLGCEQPGYSWSTPTMHSIHIIVSLHFLQPIPARPSFLGLFEVVASGEEEEGVSHSRFCPVRRDAGLWSLRHEWDRLNTFSYELSCAERCRRLINSIRQGCGFGLRCPSVVEYSFVDFFFENLVICLWLLASPCQWVESPWS